MNNKVGFSWDSRDLDHTEDSPTCEIASCQETDAKYGTNEHTYKAETDSHSDQTCGLQGGGGWVGEARPGDLGLTYANYYKRDG